MDLFETNSNRQSIKYYIKEKVPLYLVIQKGIDVEYKVILIKSFMINEINNAVWWMEYTEKGKSGLRITHNWKHQYSLFENEKEALEYVILSLKKVVIEANKKIGVFIDKFI
jgi:hypothetical protein